MAERINDIDRHNINIVNRSTETDLATVLIATVQSKPGSLIINSRADSIWWDLKRLSEILPEDELTKLKVSTSLALAMWEPKDGDDQRPLEELAIAVAEIDAKEAIGPLISLVDSRIKFDLTKASIVVSVLAGDVLGKEKAVQDKLRSWMSQERFEPFAGMLMNSLSGSFPGEYPQFLERYCEVSAAHPDYFLEDMVIEGLQEILGEHGIAPEEVQSQYRKQKALALIRTMTTDELSELSSQVQEQLI